MKDTVIYTDEDLLAELQEMIRTHSGQWVAEYLGVSVPMVSMLRNGKSPVGVKTARAMGYKRAWIRNEKK